MAVARHAGPDAAVRLSALHAASPDVRAALRVVPPAYMDALAAATETAGLVAAGAWHGPAQGVWRPSAPGTRLQERLVELALSGADEAAAMLAELLSNAGAGDRMPLHQLLDMQNAAARTLVARLGDYGARLDTFATLLSAAGALAAARDATAAAAAARGWIQDLVLAAADAVAPPEDTAAAAPALCLLAQLLAQHGAAATEALAGHQGLRVMARRIIALLSQPAPLVVAPALHVLTRILLHSYPEPAPGGQQFQELARLAGSLGCKLFDADHIDRTLVLIADLCLDCHSAATTTSTADARIVHDLRVLREVAGTVDALARTEREEARTLFFQSATLTSALGHLVSMAKLDRRYLGPLLAMVNSILDAAGGSVAQPAVATLFDGHDYGQADSLRDSSAPAPSIVDELFDIVLSGIEDAADTVPRFALPPADWLDTGLLDVSGAAKGAGRPEAARAPWPRVSSEECGGGWFVSCSTEQRQQIHMFVRLALAAQPGTARATQATCWIQELVDAAVQVLGAFLLPAGLDSPNAPVGDPLGAMWVGASPLDPVAYLRALQAQHATAGALPSVLGAYYWAVRPVVSLLADVTPLMRPAADHWRGAAGSGELGGILRWAASVCAGLLGDGSAALLGDALLDDMCQILGAPEAGLLAECVMPLAAPDSAATPSEPASPDLGCDIAVSDLRAACSGGQLEIAAATTSQLAQAAVLRHWARTCEAELAAMLVACDAQVAQHDEQLEQAKAVHGLVQRAQRLVQAPLCAARPEEPLLFFDKLPLALAVRRRHLALQQPLAARLSEQRARLAESERENSRLRCSLRQAHEASAAQLDCSAQQAQAIQRLEADAAKWKAEHDSDRSRLEQSEAAAAEARQQLVRLADRHDALQTLLDTKQAAWDVRQVSLTESIRKLELALGGALARIRELETKCAADSAASEHLRTQAALMSARLAELAQVSETLYGLSRMPH
ncbi:hypothetical protein H4R19_000708 [Coemansia spiralis]|nr:hypothetical protein H4R19_000708 [Coemansia spiralis]